MDNNAKIVQFPEPHEKEYIVTTDENNEVTGYYVKTRKNSLGVNWVGVYQSFMLWIATQGLTGEQYNVLMYMMSKLDFDNYLRITQVSICNALNMHKSNVSKSIKKLIELDILTIGPKVGTAKTYRLNPRMAHKGKHIKQTIIDYDELKKRQKEK